MGYYVGDAASMEDAKHACEQQLPGYMVPSLLMPLDAWPLNTSGKVDRKALPAPDWSGQATEYVAPAGELEEKRVGGKI